MKKLQVFEDLCPQNHPCPSVKVCPFNALIQDGFKAPRVDYDKCVACGKCANFCPKKALKIVEV